MDPVAIALTTVGWLISTLISKAITALFEAWAKRVGLGEEFITLNKELTNIESTLESADRLQTKNSALLSLLKDLQQLAYEADDLLDELDYYRIQDDIELYGGGHSSSSHQMTGSTGSSSSSSSSGFKLASRRVLSAFKQGCCSSASDDVVQTQSSFQNRITMSQSSFQNRITMSSRMNELIIQLSENSANVHKQLMLEATVTNKENHKNQATDTNPRETTSRMIERVVGRDQEHNNLINLIVGEEAATQTISVIAIVGHGGVGKTTLAQSVYNDKLRVKTDRFKLMMWVTVSVNFDVKRLTREILQCASGNDHKNIENLDKLQTTLEESLKEKRFLLVLDDLWEDKNTDSWKVLLAPLKNSSKKGNVVLVTTRKPGITKLDSTIKSFNLDGLDWDRYWPLFKLYAFQDEMHEGNLNLQDIGRTIARKLKGNPLAAKTVGSLLRRDLRVMHWRTVLESEEWRHDDTYGIMPALRISYDYLPVHLQHCFSYCALYRKDFKFSQEFIVNLWIAQSFIHNPKKRLEDVGKKYLDDLVDFGFLQRIDVEYREPLYVMHDLLHDLAQNVSSEECASDLDGQEIQEIPHTIRHLSISGDSEKHLIKVENHLKAGKLRTLLIGIDVNIKRIEGFPGRLKDARGLRVLLSNDISITITLLRIPLNFTHLRYLSLWSDSTTLPREICYLYHLQVLDVRDWKNLEELPNKFSDLINLRHFIVRERFIHSLIASVGKLANIQELCKFNVRMETEYSIEQLRELKQLRDRLSIYNLENVKSLEEAKGAGLIEKPFLNRLYISWNRENPNVAHAADADVLDGLHPHPNLAKLKITGYGGASSVAWLNSLTNLEEVYLQACVAWEILPPLGQLPLLKRLYLINMPAVKEIGPDLYGTCSQHIPFQCLEVMKLEEMPNLLKWVWNDQCQNLPALLKLSITECPQLDFSLSPLYFNEKVTVHLKNVEPFGFFNLSESELRIHEPKNPKAWDVVSFQKLRTGPITSLHINSNDPYPLSWDDLLSLVYLKELIIFRCFVPFSLPNKEIYNQTRPQLTTLKELDLIECGITGEQLTWVLHHMPMLSHLNLHDCRKIKSIGVATFTASPVVELNKDEENLHLSELVSNYSSGLLCPSEIKQPISNACLHQTGLQELRLFRMSELTSISLEGLTSLTRLYLCDMEKLEFLDFTSCVALEVLKMKNCPRLASLNCLKSLVHLKHLRVECLPLFVDAWISASEEGSFTALEKLTIDTFSIFAEHICRQLKSLQKLTIQDKDALSMTGEQEEALLHLTSLKVIRFYFCRNLQVLPEKLHQLHTLEKLEICLCENIQSPPENGLPKSLRSLKVYGCGNEVQKLFKEYECGPGVEEEDVWD